ncbi:MAG: ComEC/Rec2 family competence protein, partial [Planctomycetota bacterium]|nr:ComEC/Rec2 family competence protein [Planctomycetota bacterium]
VQAIAALLAWMLARAGLSKRRALLTVLALAAAYACFTGAQPPVVRAVLMIAAYAGAFLFYRSQDPLSTLAAAALAILAWSPGDLFLPGFQLSFLAVLALVTLYPTLEAAWLVWRGLPEAWIVDPEEQPRLRWERRIRRACFVSLAAWAGTAPAVAWHMGNFTLPSLATNLVAVPLSMFGMAASAVGMLPGLGAAAGVFNLPFDLLLGLNRFVAAFSWASIDVPAPSVPVCLAYAGVMSWAWLGRAQSATAPRLALMLPTAFLALAAGLFFRAAPEAPRVTVLDLSRGRAALVETPAGEAALIDAGGEGQGPRIAESLRRQGLRALAILVITEDEPETLGGVRELLDRMEIRRAVLPRANAPSAALRALETELARRGIPYGPPDFSADLRGPGDIRWSFGSDAPPGEAPGSGSEALAVRVGLAGSSVLFAHARSSEGLKRLLANHARMLEAQALRIVPGDDGHWPAETALLLARSGARTVVAGEGGSFPEDGTGLDLSALCASKGLRWLAPRREGSLRLGERGALVVEAFRNGRWEAAP